MKTDLSMQIESVFGLGGKVHTCVEPAKTAGTRIYPRVLPFKELVLNAAERYAPRDEVAMPCSRLLVLEQKYRFSGGEDG